MVLCFINSLILRVNLLKELIILGSCIIYKKEKKFFFRKKITQVYEADLKNEDGFIFQLELDKDIEDSSCGSLQFKCNSEFEMKKWMESITRTLSISVFIYIFFI